MRTLISQLAPLVLRHLDAYVEVAGEDLREAAGHVARRLIALLVAGACAIVALLMFCTWILLLLWETPWRAWAAAGLALAFAAGAGALAWPALKRGVAPPALFFARIRGEFNRDRELIERAYNSRTESRNGDEPRAD